MTDRSLVQTGAKCPQPGLYMVKNFGTSVDTHPIPLCMQTQLILHFTNSSDISTYQIPYRRQIRKSKRSDCVPESIAHWRMYSQLHTAPLSFAKPFHMILRTFQLHSTLFHTIPNHFWPVIQLFQHVFINITLQPLGRRIRDVPTFQIWCLHIHTPSGMSIMVFRRLSASIPLWWFSIFSISTLFIVFCIYCTHLFSKTQVHTLPHSTESLRDTI